jgi:hypothetical protein
MEDIKLDGVALTGAPTQEDVYPMIQEMTFKAYVKSRDEGITLLTAIQTLVNELGVDQVVSMFNYACKNPSMVQKAKKYLPYLSMLK